MINDPIIEEIRRHRATHAAQFNHDLAAICADFRQKQQQYRDRIVTPPQPPHATNSKLA